VEEIPKIEKDVPVRSPFSGIQSPLKSDPKRRSGFGIWVVTGIVCLAVLAFIFGQRALRDPLRTLQSFPVQEYYENYSSLEGTRFKAELKAVHQVGWKEDVGRLVVFNIDQTENPVVILISPKDEATSIKSGDRYLAEIRVTEGGLLTAQNLRKE